MDGVEDPFPSRPSGVSDRIAQNEKVQAFERLSKALDQFQPSLTLRPLAREVVNIAVQGSGADRGVLFLNWGSESGLIPVVAVDVRGEELEHIEQVSRSLLKRAKGGETIHSDDALTDPVLSGIGSVAAKKIRSVLALPLYSSAGVPMGVLHLDSLARTGAFGAPARMFLERFARIAAASLDHARLYGETRWEAATLRRLADSQAAFSQLVFRTPRTAALLERARMAAHLDQPVLIIGEPGTEKEQLARAVYDASLRTAHPFVAGTCSQVLQDKLDEVLFGRIGESGAEVRSGLAQEANRGILFLDDIGKANTILQQRLHKMITERVIRPAGARRDHPIDVRLIGGTSENLRALAGEKRFLQELYEDLAATELYIPPLRERREDIPLLIQHFLQKHGQMQERRRPLELSDDAIEYLQRQPWPGNVRQLESLIQRALVLLRSPLADALDMERLIQSGADASVDVYGTTREPRPAALPEAGIDRYGPFRPIEDHEKDLILEAMIRTRGNKSAAAEMLGVHRNTLARKIRKMDIPFNRTRKRRSKSDSQKSSD